MGPKRKFKTNELNIGEKLKLIKDYNSGQYKQQELSDKYEIAIGTVSNITRNQEKYTNVSLNRNKKSKRVKCESNSEKLNDLVYKFIQSSNANKIPISGPIIRGFALELASNMGLKEFKASNGWLEKFNKRFDVRYNSFAGEASDVNEEVVNNWITKIDQLIAGFEPKDIFNFDETGLFYKILPKKSYMVKGSKYVGRKKAKQRITLGLCCSLLGEKLKPVVIGTARKPRCFKCIKYNINSLGVDYYSNSSAWMTQILFDKWLKKLDTKFKSENRKILLFVDNCSTHKTPENLENVTIKYFPANTTSRLQPLDQGVIHSFKAKYKTYFVKYFTSKIAEHIEEDPELKEPQKLQLKIKQLLQSIDLKNAIQWITSSWDNISSEVISNCFRHSGFNIDCDEEEFDDDLSEMSEVFSQLQQNINQTIMTSSEFTEFEDNFETHNSDWKQDLLNEALSNNNDCDNEVEEIELSDDNSSPETETSIPSLQNMLEMTEKMEVFIMKETPQVLIQFNKVKDALINLKLKKQFSKQTSITDFFTRK